MSTPPGKPQGTAGSSTVSAGEESLSKEKEDDVKKKPPGKFGYRDADKPDG